MSDDPLFSDIDHFLKNSREDRAGLAFLESLGYEGAVRFIEETEAAYQAAAAGIELSGEEVARITALAHAVARACRIDSAESKEALSKLVEVGWLMSRWFNGGD
jgi:hypothetical protein